MPPPYPSPTTTHLMACIGAAAAASRRSSGPPCGALPGAPATFPKARRGRGSRPPPAASSASLPTAQAGVGRRWGKNQRLYPPRQRPPPQARGVRKQEAAAPLTSGQARALARSRVFPDGARGWGSPRLDANPHGEARLHFGLPRPPRSGTFGRARLPPSALGNVRKGSVSPERARHVFGLPSLARAAELGRARGNSGRLRFSLRSLSETLGNIRIF